MNSLNVLLTFLSMYLRLGVVDGLDGTERRYQGRCLGEVGGGRGGVKVKQHSLANDAANDIVVVSSPAVDEPVVAAGNTEDVNVG
ncbi:hypothetical protein Tco_1012810 [Tanacetum coccineum]